MFYAFGTQGGLLGQMIGKSGEDFLSTVPLLIVCIANVWRNAAFSMLVFTAGLRNVPEEIDEAAQLEGASYWRRLFTVTLPILRPTIVTNLLLLTLINISDFTLIFVMTQGGPGTSTAILPVYMYIQAFQFNNLGYGSMIALALVLIGALLSLFYVRQLSAEVQAMSMPSLLPRRRARAAALPRPDVVVVDYPRASVGGVASNLVLAAVGRRVLRAADLAASSPRSTPTPGPSLQWPKLTFSNFSALFNSTRLQPFVNSLYLAGVSTLITTVLAVLAAYGLSRRHIPLKRTFMLIVLFASGLPVNMLLVPVYQLFVRLNWLDSLFYTSLFLAAGALPFAIWLLKNFIDQIPEEFEEAAALEGAGSLQILWRVILPNALPGRRGDRDGDVHRRLGRVHRAARAQLRPDDDARARSRSTSSCASTASSTMVSWRATRSCSRSRWSCCI